VVMLATVAYQHETRSGNITCVVNAHSSVESIG
jgi:hypothetical protein